MAYSNTTPNYDLPQYIGTDIPNPLTDFNGAMSTIDTTMKNIADGVGASDADIAALQAQNGDEHLTTTAQTLSGAVNELDSDVGSLDTRLTTVETNQTADESTLSTAVSNLSTVTGKVSALETQNGNAVLTTTAQTLSGAVNELDADIVSTNTAIGEVGDKAVGTRTTKTLAANATSIQFDVPTTGDNLVDFYVSDGSQPTAINTAIAGEVTLTFDAVASARTVVCEIKEA